MNNYTAQINSIVAKRDADMLSLEGQGRGITETIIGGQQAQINREAAIRALPVQAQLAAAQGRLDQATEYLNTMFTIKKADADAKYNRSLKIIDTYFDYADKAEQRQFEEIKVKKAQQYEQQQQLLNTQNQLMQMALTNRAPKAVQDAILASKDTTSAIQAAGVYGTDMLNRQLKLEQIASARRANQPGPVKRDTAVIEQDGKKLLIDAQTGEVIKDYSGSSASTDALQKYEKATTELEYDMNVVQRALKNDFGLQTSVGALRNATLSGLVAGPNLVGGIVGATQARVAKDNFLNDVNYLINKEGFQRLQEIKAASGTLGQITEKEFERVSKSASVLNSSAIRDDQENLVGFRGDEEAIRRELNVVMQGYMTIQDQLNAKMGLTEDELDEIDNTR